MSYDNMSSVSQNVLKFYQQLTSEERRIPFIFGRNNLSTLLAKSKLHSTVKKIMIITLFIPYYKKKSESYCSSWDIQWPSIGTSITVSNSFMQIDLLVGCLTSNCNWFSADLFITHNTSNCLPTEEEWIWK
jgi:hypothetical protein